VFGWQFDEWGPPDFYLIKTGHVDDPGILGALQKRTQPLGAGFNGYECSISVEDVKAIGEKVVEHGGKIVFNLMEIPTVGLLIKFTDTEGNLACAIQYFKKG
jgi:predicted enzyme related to lactoylglutathione lyase